MKPIPFARPDITNMEVAAVSEVVASGNLATGETVDKFEEAFARYTGAKYAVAVSSCTHGYQLSFDALNVRNRKVLTPTYTFTGPAMMAHRAGADVILMDNGKGQFAPGIDQYKDAAPDGDARVVMPVHFAGWPIYTDFIDQITGSALVIDDAAHAAGSHLDGHRIGNLPGTFATVFSFYATKPLSTGNGGMVTTNDEAFAQELRSLRLHGFSKDLRNRYSTPGVSWEYDIARPGSKGNMTDMAAAMGIVQLHRIYEMQAHRVEIAHLYHQGLKGVPGITLPYQYADQRGHAWHLFPILLHRGSRTRDMLHKKLAEDGIGTSVHFIPLHRHTAWKNIVGEVDMPNADTMFKAELSLPIYSGMSSDDVFRVIEAVTKHMKEIEACCAA